MHLFHILFVLYKDLRDKQRVSVKAKIHYNSFPITSP